MSARELDRAQAAIQRIRARKPRALGLALDLRRPDGAPLRIGDDPRRAVLEQVAIAVPESNDAALHEPGHTKVLVLERELLGPDRAISLLAPLWEEQPDEPPPYLVFAHAQSTLTVLAGLAEHAALPHRYGCVTTAATLLAEGADRRRDHRPVDVCLRDTIGCELPEGLLAQQDERLACEAEALLALMQIYTPKLRERRLASVYRFECELVPAVVAMERAGVGIDAASFERIAGGWVRERNEFDSLPEALRDADRMARLDKLISTYRWWGRDHVDPDQRIRCRLHPLATDTGRFSCSDPNLQQVPAEHTAPGLRGCFVPAPGYVFVTADYAQIELRVAAHLAPCDALRAVFRAGRDPHRATAANLSGKPEHAIDEHERKLAKAVNFGFLFGMGAKRFRSYAKDSYGLELDDRQAEDARDAFFRTFPGIAAWHRRVRGLSRIAEREPITVHTVMGRRRTFPAGQFSFNAALNIPVQGSAAEGFKLAMLRLHEQLPSIGGRGVLVVHDEYLAEVPSDRAEQGREIVERVMVEAMRELIDSVPIVADARVTTHWG